MRRSLIGENGITFFSAPPEELIDACRRREGMRIQEEERRGERENCTPVRFIARALYRLAQDRLPSYPRVRQEEIVHVVRMLSQRFVRNNEALFQNKDHSALQQVYAALQQEMLCKLRSLDQQRWDIPLPKSVSEALIREGACVPRVAEGGLPPEAVPTRATADASISSRQLRRFHPVQSTSGKGRSLPLFVKKEEETGNVPANDDVSGAYRVSA